MLTALSVGLLGGGGRKMLGVVLALENIIFLQIFYVQKSEYMWGRRLYRSNVNLHYINILKSWGYKPPRIDDGVTIIEDMDDVTRFYVRKVEHIRMDPRSAAVWLRQFDEAVILNEQVTTPLNGQHEQEETTTLNEQASILVS